MRCCVCLGDLGVDTATFMLRVVDEVGSAAGRRRSNGRACRGTPSRMEAALAPRAVARHDSAASDRRRVTLGCSNACARALNATCSCAADQGVEVQRLVDLGGGVALAPA